MAGSRRTAARVTFGAISLSSSNHFAPMPYSKDVKPVMLPPGRARLSTRPCANRIGDVREHDRHGARRSPQYPGSRTAWTEDDVRRQPNQFGCLFSSIILVSPGPTVVDLEVLPNRPAQLLQPLQERRVALLPLRVVGGIGHQRADSPYPLSLLPAGRHRPRRRRAADERDELAAPHVEHGELPPLPL